MNKSVQWKRLFPLPDSGKVEAGRVEAATVQALIADLVAQEAETRRYDNALQSLTPGGSEFISDPDRCVAFVQQMRSADFETLKRQKIDADRAFSMLEANGVPRERDKSVANGIDVLSTRFRREIRALEEVIASLRAAIEAEAASHDLHVPENALLARYHREHAAVLRGALAGKGEERVREEMERA
jgi:hypothetical protein